MGYCRLYYDFVLVLLLLINCRDQFVILHLKMHDSEDLPRRWAFSSSLSSFNAMYPLRSRLQCSSIWEVMCNFISFIFTCQDSKFEVKSDIHSIISIQGHKMITIGELSPKMFSFEWKLLLWHACLYYCLHLSHHRYGGIAIKTAGMRTHPFGRLKAEFWQNQTMRRQLFVIFVKTCMVRACRFWVGESMQQRKCLVWV